MAAFPVRPMESLRGRMLKAEVLAEARGVREAPASGPDLREVPLDVRPAQHKASWKILFLVAEDFSFWARRRPLARGAQEGGGAGEGTTRPGPFAEKCRAQAL